MSHTIPPAPADRLAFIIEGLCQAVARRGDARRSGLFGLAGPLIILVWSRLRRITARFARHAITPLAPSRPARPRPIRLRQSQPLPLPRRKAWLLRLVPETASGAAQLRHFLADPEVAALLATAPQLRRILRPLCHMLGIRPAQALPAQALPPDAAPSACPISYHAPPQAGPAAFPPIAFLPWTTTPLSPDSAPVPAFHMMA